VREFSGLPTARVTGIQRQIGHTTRGGHQGGVLMVGFPIQGIVPGAGAAVQFAVELRSRAAARVGVYGVSLPVAYYRGRR